MQKDCNGHQANDQVLRGWPRIMTVVRIPEPEPSGTNTFGIVSTIQAVFSFPMLFSPFWCSDFGFGQI